MRIFTRSILLILLGFLPIGAYAEISVLSASIQSVPADEEDASINIRIRNDDRYDVYLVSASSSAAETLSLQSEQEMDGENIIQPVNEIKLPGEQIVTLPNSNYRLQLINLKRPLSNGDQVDLSLSLSNGKTITVTAQVK